MSTIVDSLYESIQQIMTEVRALPNGSHGLFATQSFAIGDVILEESEPLLRLRPSSDDDAVKLLAALPPVKKGGAKDDKISFLASIVPPSSLSKGEVGQFLGMIQAASCFAEFEQGEDALSEALKLYAPPLLEDQVAAPAEEAIVRVTREALKYMKNHSKGESKLRKFVRDRPDEALKLMLVWTCNAFEGGRIYVKHSRINHSCDPNAIIQANDDQQVLRAAAAIAAGDEVKTSYLGLLLYADRPTRQSHLVSMKHFQCTCTRCTAPDPASATPCPTCHPRDGRYLDEDVAYDDDKQVRYMFPRNEQLTTFECLKCKTALPDTDNVISVLATVSQKVLVHMQDMEIKVPDADDTDDMEEEWEEQMYQLSCSVAGTLHWTTNIVSFMRLNRALKRHHASMIQTGENPDLEEVAEAIDMLERLCRFINGLELKLHMGHVLSNEVMGVARTLVSLGDEKSKKYAAEWVEKIKGYTDVFETEGMQKVAASLLNAWETRDNEPAAKKQKSK